MNTVLIAGQIIGKDSLRLAKTPRETALLILCKTEYEGAYPNLELKKMPRDMDRRDKALVTSLVYGVISKKLTLDLSLIHI